MKIRVKRRNNLEGRVVQVVIESIMKMMYVKTRVRHLLKVVIIQGNHHHCLHVMGVFLLIKRRDLVVRVLTRRTMVNHRNTTIKLTKSENRIDRILR